MDGVDATVDVWFICPTTIRKTVISALSVTGSVFMLTFRLFLGFCMNRITE